MRAAPVAHVNLFACASYHTSANLLSDKTDMYTLREESNAEESFRDFREFLQIRESLMPRNIIFWTNRESLFSRKIVDFNSQKLIPIFFHRWYFFTAKNTVSLHFIFLLQLNRESLFLRKMTKAAIRESKFPKFREFVSSRKFLPHYFLPL